MNAATKTQLDVSCPDRTAMTLFPEQAIQGFICVHLRLSADPKPF
jgi:hypothetical protein